MGKDTSHEKKGKEKLYIKKEMMDMKNTEETLHEVSCTDADYKTLKVKH